MFESKCVGTAQRRTGPLKMIAIKFGEWRRKRRQKRQEYAELERLYGGELRERGELPYEYYRFYGYPGMWL